ncbi:M1 family metallopeptidase [Pseudochryseolinea flava]|uniref:M1 family peptidase n=1 Tax=Pseudochryseolinea flava TaxID=2059302 RepID=A0A364Y0B7_9BACT|nr:M1 family metallopeptidase [Pseudochryseolinea flava]RAV99524.1 M1 family peptidase [Pseudochryseolinea flava]
MLRLGAVTIFSFITFTLCFSQDFRWQQRVEYDMNVRLDVNTHRIAGTQKLVYYNNSRDTLSKVYYHLYFNAFQPGSMMDIRSRNIADPDPRVGDRISKLREDEIGYQHIETLKQDGKAVTWRIDGTVMEVTLAKAILPNTKTVFEMKFESQVPVQIRRTGRNSKEGISYSMTQWYPKMAEYDFQGWHAYPYVAREFHGVWGDFDVKITIDPTFVIGGTGKLQNPDKIGHNYEKPGTTVKRPEGDLTWHFIAKNVIDFAWAADPDYTHEKAQVPNGPELHFFFQKSDKTTDNWIKLKDYAVKHFQFMSTTFGKYPYDTYSIIQGGDGGMEYPMCTLITSERSLGSLVGVMAHEVAHSWYQGVLASNEGLYPWLDEGFADFSSQEAMGVLVNDQNIHAGSYAAYFSLVKSGLQEPLSTHADHYNTNRAYSIASYSLGTVFLQQLKYVIGEDNFYKGMRRYYYTWKFKHPEPADFIRVMEKVSGLQLKWYLNYWINSTKKIDYGIQTVIENQGATFVTLQRIGDFPMPIDLVVTYKDGSKELYYIPLGEMLGTKQQENTNINRIDLQAWPWVNPSYVVRVGRPSSEIASVEIDPSLRMADIERKNNKVDLSAAMQAFEYKTK